MRKNELITPAGTGDLMYEQCEIRAQMAGKLRALLEMRGHREVKTPMLEFYDVFDSSSTYFPEEEMYKLIDNRGRLLVVRPDCTVPIARMTATRLKNERKPLRLYYHQDIMRVSPDMRGQSNEVTQVGAEVIGVSSYLSDLDVVATAAQCLKELCGENFSLEICHIGFFKALIGALQAPERVKEEIRDNIEAKNFAALGDLLEPYGEERAAVALRALPRLFGGKETLAKAAELFEQEEASKVLSYLSRLWDDLESLGLGDNILVDLGLVNEVDYYTGVIFRGYMAGAGTPVLSGGRYDTLARKFGEALPATGFAVDIDSLAKQVLSGMPKAKEQNGILLHAEEGYALKALRYQEELQREGKLCELSLCQSEGESLAYGASKGRAQLHVVGEEIRIIQIEKGGCPK